MKATLTVITTTMIEVTVDDNIFTPAELNEFEQNMFALDSHATREHSLLSYIGIQIAISEGTIEDIECVGKATRKALVREFNPVVRFDIIDTDHEVEISEET
ncbi:hypothetical protein [Methylovulum miyakonense]|uniref:hypothetical protein n=1 Tax=Methylovulum miyakonense TaxID=645578 RepID=UPI00036F08B3|nr:hypothetical protein [Methylovulum miyakonense]